MPADAVEIARVRVRSWQVAYAHAFPADALAGLSHEAGLEWWTRALEDPYPHMHTLVAEDDGEVIGFASLGAAREDDVLGLGELFAIYVHPDAWGRGAGRALMAETLARLRAEGFGEAILWVLDDNPRTRRFYEQCGWRADGGVKEEEWLGTRIREVRYRIRLDSYAS
jgi:GNAT superfamily N-acetyltransferase